MCGHYWSEWYTVGMRPAFGYQPIERYCSVCKCKEYRKVFVG